MGRPFAGNLPRAFFVRRCYFNSALGVGVSVDWPWSIAADGVAFGLPCRPLPWCTSARSAEKKE
ncbi:MAG: hypothetical protein D6691_02575 [Candidatus Hydrogenedentota bacterium]|nr:MAG: hypothetical protein D6691_02575 [Candidatus Hydrogenedentota bacterium]